MQRKSLVGSGRCLLLLNPQSGKHPLENEWTWWYFKKDNNLSWEDSLIQVRQIHRQNVFRMMPIGRFFLKVMTFNTVEDFWALYNHICLPSELLNDCDYSLFKSGIKPMWEDPANKNGGRWLFNIVCKNPKQLDQAWLEILLCLIGEGFQEHSLFINGVVLNIRPKANKMSLWLSTVQPPEVVNEVGRSLKSRLKFANSYGDITMRRLVFETHEDSQRKSQAPKHLFVL